MKKTAIRGALLAMLVIAAPFAAADRPANFTVNIGPFVDVDPCTGELHEVTLFFDIYEHQGHNNNFVAKVIRTGWTDSGYEMFAGGETFIINQGVVMGRFKDMWRNDDGRMFEVSANFVLNFNQFEVKVNRFGFRCIGG